jgi:hypothetical protein
LANGLQGGAIIVLDPPDYLRRGREANRSRRLGLFEIAAKAAGFPRTEALV